MAAPGGPEEVRTVAVVGTGIIGSGWAALFLAKGYAVRAFVRSPAREEKFRGFLESAWSKLLVRGIATEKEGWRAVVCVPNLAECVAVADYVQESVPEELAMKQLLIREIDEFAPARCVIGSSSSYIPLSLMRLRAAKHPERVATAHPSLPQWDAFCEVFASSPEVTQLLERLFRDGVGMDVVVMERQNYGHVLNSLLASISVTANLLLRSGVTDAAGLDVAATHLGRLLTCSGGLTGALVGLVGGGSTAATTELTRDIVMGAPLGLGATLASRVLPSCALRPGLWLMQALFSPLQLLRGPARFFANWTNTPLYERWPAVADTYVADTLHACCALDRR